MLLDASKADNKAAMLALIVNCSLVSRETSTAESETSEHSKKVRYEMTKRINKSNAASKTNRKSNKSAASKTTNRKSAASKTTNRKSAAASKSAASKSNATIVARTRVTILDKSATSVLKALGALGYNLAQARAVCAALATGELKNSTIATALSDGRNSKYNSSAATLTKQEQAKLARIAKQAN